MANINSTLTALKSQPFKQLYRHYVAMVSKHRPSVTAIAEQVVKDGTTSDPPAFEQIHNTTVEQAISKSEEVNPLFGAYCIEAENIYNTGDEALKKQYEKTIEEYRFLRQAAALEMHIMELNRVGVDKNLKNIIE